MPPHRFPTSRARLLVAVLVAVALASRPRAASAADPAPPANRLAKETSPYLLLHAHNPVDWYPWGPEAFAKAKAEKKPIFLSIGYSSCYWCHVMERESFTDPEIARLLNTWFVSVKVDREERPDVDQIYMTALQSFSHGGWPMSMFLTPDGRPFYGGTYFPPRERDGMPGFATILKGVAEAWRDERPEVEKSADRLVEIVRRALAGSTASRRVRLARGMAAAGRSSLAEQFDPEFGGFGYNPDNARRPKFPEPVNLVFLLDQHRRAPAPRRAPNAPAQPDPLSMVLVTLDHMARGGIRDHLAGGYHRYATSRYWIVPHFEKMLYDNAQLAAVHLLAFEITGDPRWRREAEDIFAFVARSMTAPEGGFYSALDAETHGEEGQYYVWTRDEIKQVLGGGEDDEVFAQVYGLKRPPNFAKDRYVLLEPRGRAERAESLKTTPEALEARLAPLRAQLLAVRDRRPAPLRDDKVLTSWNGLMIAAYAEGFRVLRDPRSRRAAERAADFVLAKLRTGDGRLLRSYRAGQAKLPAYLEDYAFLAHGLLRLHAATGDPSRLAQARELTERMIADFADEKQGGFFYTADDHESLLARPKDPYDNALPSGNSVAIRNLVALAAATGEPRYLDLAGRVLEAFGPALARNPSALPLMLVGLEEYLDARPELAPGDTAELPGTAPDAIVQAQAALAQAAAAAPGHEVDIILSLVIKPGWHIYAHPTGVEGLKPTSVTLETSAPATLARVDYPAGQAKVLASSGSEKVALYEGRTRMTARIRLDRDARAGPATLHFQVRFQACNDRACLAPATLTVPVRLTIGK
jgi:uncharacterized protein YyaL (SSP411 family)